MSRTLSESAIVKSVAESAAKRVTRKVIAELQRLNNALLSGEDSGLQNTWDEICVQVQDEESFAWDTYVQTMESVVGAQLSALSTHECESLWLQTSEGEDWLCDEPAERHDSPVVNDDIVRWMVSNHIIPAADNWSNPRIRAYIEHPEERD